MEIRVGTAAWTNPPQERGRRAAGSHLSHYAKAFNAVEINSCFYRSHRRTTYERWRDMTPRKFQFSVKMTRSVTHDCALQHCQPELRQFVAEIQGLGSKLRVVLVQLPPSLIFQTRVASRFFRSLSAHCGVDIACEPRHPSWFDARADDLLNRLGIARVAADPCAHRHGDLPGGCKSLVYYRLHGSPQKYYSSYSNRFLSALAGRLRKSTSATQPTWCIFDNTARHAAWTNARALQRLLG